MEFTVNNFKLRYKNTFFGYIWSFINPILMLTALYIIFSLVIKLNVPNYQLFLLIGIISWNYFSEATVSSINSLASNSNLVRKHKLDPSILVISSCLSSLIVLFISVIVFLGFLLLSNLELTAISLLSLFYLFLLLMITVGASLIITGIYFRFKDITHIWSFLLLLGFWISPIIYSESQIPLFFRKYYMLNPLARIISHLRNNYLYSYYDTLEQVFITFLICVSVLFFGFWVFRTLSKNQSEKL